MTNDWELLDRYAAKKDEPAFTELVRRHIDFVYGAARRMLGGPSRDAEDVAQAVFLLLSRKAGKIARHGALVGWLFRTTRYCCANVKSQDRRRRRREQLVAARHPESTVPGDPVSDRLEQFLDVALTRLGENERHAILVRYLEGKTIAETAAVLGASPEAVEKRLERGIRKLRATLARQGFVLPATAITAIMIAENAQAAPPALAISAAAPTAINAAAAHIATDAARMMNRTLMKIAAILTISASAGLMLLAAKILPATTPTAPHLIAASAPATPPRAPIASTRPVSDPTAPTPAQLLALLSAAHQRFATIDIQYNVRRFFPVNGKLLQNPSSTASIHYLAIPDHFRYHAEEHDLALPDPVDKTIDISVAPNVSIYLLHHPVEGVSAMIRPSPQLHQMASIYPLDGPWVPLQWAITNANSVVTRDAASGLFTLTLYDPSNTPRNVVVIDPAHGFIPIALTQYKINGQIFLHATWTQLHEIVPTLWVPFQLLCDEPGQVRIESTVTACSVTPPPSPDQLNLVLPKGANVQDGIADRIYTIGSVDPNDLPVLTATQPAAMPGTSASETLAIDAGADGPAPSPAPPLDSHSFPRIQLQLHRGQQASLIVPVIRKDQAPVGALTITCPAHWATAEAQTPIVRGKQSFLLHIAPPQSAAFGPHQLAVTIAGPDKGDNAELPLFINVLSTISANPSALLITPPQSKYQVALHNFAGAQPTLASFDCTSAGLAVSSCTQNPATPDTLTLTVQPAPAATGFLSADLHLHFKNQPAALLLQLCAYIPPR